MSVEAIGALGDPMRRSIYEFAVSRRDAVSRDDVARELGIGRTLAAFHLDRLVEAGLLDVSYARRSGRTGPGAGRPAKLYRRSSAEHEVSLPPRRYLSAADLLAATVERAGVDERLFEAAREYGRLAGRATTTATTSAGQLAALLADQGYEPDVRPNSIVLRNCPFHRLARDHPPLICGMNLALIEGLIEGLDRPTGAARIAPEPEGCCVVIDLASKNKDR